MDHRFKCKTQNYKTSREKNVRNQCDFRLGKEYTVQTIKEKLTNWISSKLTSAFSDSLFKMKTSRKLGESICKTHTRQSSIQNTYELS